MSLRVAVMWPSSRKNRWRSSLEFPAQFPDLSDGLLFLEDEGIHVSIEDSLRFPWNPLAFHSVFCGLDPLRSARVIARIRRYDAIISVGCTSAPFLVWLVKALGIRVPVLLIDPALSNDYPRLKQLQDKVLPFVEKVIVYGHVQLDYLRSEYGARVNAVFIPHRIDTDFYCPESPRSGHDTGDSVILSIGNDISRDFDTLLRAATCCDAIDEFGHRVVIHTSLPVNASCSRVEFRRDYVSFIELRELYRQCSIVVLPLRDTIHAGGINSLLEAMAMGKAVVVSGSRGISDYVVHNETAYVVAPGDSTGMAHAIQHLLESPGEGLRLGQNARAFAVGTCRNSLYARSVAAIIHGMIDTDVST